ncbi:MAG: hypothetical protein GX685_02420, partial [Clostridiales bacterium]|nr:hypothetical protein [Clostridiales bacterium]
MTDLNLDENDKKARNLLEEINRQPVEGGSAPEGQAAVSSEGEQTGESQHGEEVVEEYAENQKTYKDDNVKDTTDVNNYTADDIQVLEGLEAVRKRPGMYIGTTSSRGLHHLVYEIVDNSVDEALAGFCTHIEVTVHPDNSITVKDDGRGIPVGINHKTGKSALEVVFSILHAGGKFGGGGYAVSGGLHGVGSSVVNALSTRFDVSVKREGFTWNMSFTDSVPNAPLAKGEPSEETGTTITFWPSAEIFETVEFDYETLRTR